MKTLSHGIRPKKLIQKRKKSLRINFFKRIKTRKKKGESFFSVI